MGKRNSTILFNSIANIYGLFYEIQKKRFSEVIEIVEKELDIKEFKTILDVGCGTGALCSVLDGMGQEERKLMYAEMSRVTKSKVIIYDYNEKRSLSTTIIEWLEGGDYFNFIKIAESEMRECFSDVKIVYVGVRATWYICTPK